MPQRITDRDYREGPCFLGQSKNLVDLFLVKQMARRQRCAQSQSPRGKQHVLHGWVNRRSRSDSASRITDKAANDQHRRFVKVLGQMVSRREHSLFLRLGLARRWRRGVKALFEILERAFVS